MKYVPWHVLKKKNIHARENKMVREGRRGKPKVERMYYRNNEISLVLQGKKMQGKTQLFDERRKFQQCGVRLYTVLAH
jgi:hypothetical protein